jgi:Tfp pilus assembly protein PilV
MCELCQVFQRVRLNPKGFVLLEVLVAMGLILGSWMALVATYQSLTLRTAQEDNKRTQLRKEFDAFEIGEQVRANANTPLQGMSNESTRMSGRARAVYATSKSPLKNKR